MAKKSDEIIPRETPINAPITFSIMLMASDLKSALDLYDGLVAAGVNPSRISASVRQPNEGVARTSSPVMAQAIGKGVWEAKYNGEYGKLVIKQYVTDALASVGKVCRTREEHAQAIYELRAANRWEKHYKGVMLDGRLFARDGSDDDSSESSNAGEGADTSGLGEIDVDEVV